MVIKVIVHRTTKAIMALKMVASRGFIKRSILLPRPPSKRANQGQINLTDRAQSLMVHGRQWRSQDFKTYDYEFALLLWKYTVVIPGMY